jgi:hypothetical protein
VRLAYFSLGSDGRHARILFFQKSRNRLKDSGVACARGILLAGLL